MRVALFAPNIAIDHGGVWQFVKWVYRELGTKTDMSLIAPSALFDELAETGITFEDTPGCIRVEQFRDVVEKRLPYRLIARHGGLVRGRYTPTVLRKAANVSRRIMYGDSVAACWMLDDLARNGVDVVHVPVQEVACRALAKRFPYVINPHDFQHEHFPGFFSRRVMAYRRNRCYASQRKASAVVVHSRQTLEDAIRFLGIAEEKIFYAPYGPLKTFPEPDADLIERTRDRFGLPERFMFYPSRSWPHKNHETLIDSMAQLQERGVETNVVFTDMSTPYGEAVIEKAARLGLERQVHVVGRVSDKEMGALYHLCTMVVVPSLFEQNSGPMLEAIQLGKAVAVSNLPELVATLDGAAPVFDGKSPAEMADAIDPLWCSDEQRKSVEKRIRICRDRMSWEPFRKVYEQAYAYAAAAG